MIPGFEEFTQDVKQEELEEINLIALGLSRRIGIANAITNTDMRERLYLHSGINITDAKLRRYIQYIRAYRLVSMLCASKKGYYVAKDKEEFIKYRENFRSRIRSMQFTIACKDLDQIENNIIT